MPKRRAGSNPVPGTNYEPILARSVTSRAGSLDVEAGVPVCGVILSKPYPFRSDSCIAASQAEPGAQQLC